MALAYGCRVYNVESLFVCLFVCLFITLFILLNLLLISCFIYLYTRNSLLDVSGVGLLVVHLHIC